jgi:hypothetical protein
MSGARHYCRTQILLSLVFGLEFNCSSARVDLFSFLFSFLFVASSLLTTSYPTEKQSSSVHVFRTTLLPIEEGIMSINFPLSHSLVCFFTCRDPVRCRPEANDHSTGRSLPSNLQITVGWLPAVKGSTLLQCLKAITAEAACQASTLPPLHH